MSCLVSFSSPTLYARDSATSRYTFDELIGRFSERRTVDVVEAMLPCPAPRATVATVYNVRAQIEGRQRRQATGRKGGKNKSRNVGVVPSAKSYTKETSARSRASEQLHWHVLTSCSGRKCGDRLPWKDAVTACFRTLSLIARVVKAPRCRST